MVAIKNFCMPSCCDNCDIFSWSDKACRITYTRCEEPFDSKNDDCPLIEVEPQESEDLGDFPDTIHNQFDNMTGSMNL